MPAAQRSAPRSDRRSRWRARRGRRHGGSARRCGEGAAGAGHYPSGSAPQRLTLEHQLLDRARFVKVLAGAWNEPGAIEGMERLEAAHRATVEWIDTVLDELATGHPAKLSPTTVQVAVATGRRIAFFAARQAAAAVNRSVAVIDQVQQRATRKAGEVQHRAGQTAVHAGETVQRIVRDTGEVVTAGTKRWPGRRTSSASSGPRRTAQRTSPPNSPISPANPTAALRAARPAPRNPEEPAAGIPQQARRHPRRVWSERSSVRGGRVGPAQQPEPVGVGTCCDLRQHGMPKFVDLDEQLR